MCPSLDVSSLYLATINTDTVPLIVNEIANKGCI